MGAIMPENFSRNRLSQSQMEAIFGVGYVSNATQNATPAQIDVEEELHYTHGLLGSPEKNKRFRIKITFTENTGHTVLFGEWKYSANEVDKQVVHISTLLSEKGFSINATRTDTNDDE
jgi:hypothetical protein